MGELNRFLVRFALPLSAGRQPGHVGLAVHAQRLHRRNRGHDRRHVWVSQMPWPDIAVASMVAALGLTSAVRVIRQALGEIRGAHGPETVAAE